ncbi:hypothetical protein U9M48_027755 [Paspalum notatum var. saurae]|uniref:Uncharacterized protein n=1 Tax=Paspalum notatum var. saurae TaxID=547442 RepID=A0AAQ3WZQ9_PASNO
MYLYDIYPSIQNVIVLCYMTIAARTFIGEESSTIDGDKLSSEEEKSDEVGSNHNLLVERKIYETILREVSKSSEQEIPPDDNGSTHLIDILFMQIPSNTC